jgi:hypothetical protein
VKFSKNFWNCLLARLLVLKAVLQALSVMIAIVW